MQKEEKRRTYTHTEYRYILQQNKVVAHTQADLRSLDFARSATRYVPRSKFMHAVLSSFDRDATEGRNAYLLHGKTSTA